MSKWVSEWVSECVMNVCHGMLLYVVKHALWYSCVLVSRHVFVVRVSIFHPLSDCCHRHSCGWGKAGWLASWLVGWVNIYWGFQVFGFMLNAYLSVCTRIYAIICMFVYFLWSDTWWIFNECCLGQTMLEEASLTRKQQNKRTSINNNRKRNFSMCYMPASTHIFFFFFWLSIAELCTASVSVCVCHKYLVLEKYQYLLNGIKC